MSNNWILLKDSNLNNLKSGEKYLLWFRDGHTRIGYYFSYCNPEKYFQDSQTGEIIKDKITHFMKIENPEGEKK